MNILIVYSHPNLNSFCGALKDAFAEGAQNAGHDISLVDLYAENFQPVLPQSELAGEEISDAVKSHQEKVKRADVLVFVYPVWWFRAPAIFEGWIDRVFSVGFAFNFKQIIGNYGRPVGLLKGKQAIIINTYGSPALFTKYFYMNIPFRRIKRGVLKMCGIKKIKRINCWSVPFVSQEKKEKYLNKVHQIARSL